MNGAPASKVPGSMSSICRRAAADVLAAQLARLGMLFSNGNPADKHWRWSRSVAGLRLLDHSSMDGGPHGADERLTSQHLHHCLCPQGSSCALAVNNFAVGGVAPPALEFKEMAEPPATTAARHVARYFNNVHPVSPLP